MLPKNADERSLSSGLGVLGNREGNKSSRTAAVRGEKNNSGTHFKGVVVVAAHGRRQAGRRGQSLGDQPAQIGHRRRLQRHVLQDDVADVAVLERADHADVERRHPFIGLHAAVFFFISNSRRFFRVPRERLMSSGSVGVTSVSFSELFSRLYSIADLKSTFFKMILSINP